MNLLNYNHGISSLFILSIRFYQKNIIPILFLTAALIAPAFLIGFAGWGEPESVVFFLSSSSVRLIVERGLCIEIGGLAVTLRCYLHLSYDLTDIRIGFAHSMDHHRF